ncbi:hypothetical protein ACIBQ1_27365 [Nonomuraea sp. NPDC050153]|uniref:hypothetical protein n=1 Tax=Nonomuraea sp. NPDC050153 TaxID=3364359 RepID=UPI00379541B2
MEGMSDAHRTDVTTAVEQLAWTMARKMLQLEPDAGPRSDLPDADVRQMWLAALTSLLAIRDSAEVLAASAALSAAQRGADYPAIGDAAGMTRQGARRKWPGLAGLSDERQRKLRWWSRRGDQFIQCVRAVLATSEEGPRLAALRERLDDIEQSSPAQRIDAFDMALVDAHTVAVGAPAPAGPTAERASGLLAALTADAYAAMSSHSSLVVREDLVCGTDGCPSEPIVELWRPDFGDRPVPACREHAVEALRQPATRIVAAHQPDVALSVFAEAHPAH